MGVHDTDQKGKTLSTNLFPQFSCLELLVFYHHFKKARKHSCWFAHSFILVRLFVLLRENTVSHTCRATPDHLCRLGINSISGIDCSLPNPDESDLYISPQRRREHKVKISLFAFRSLCPLGILTDKRKAIKIYPRRPLRLRGELQSNFYPK